MTPVNDFFVVGTDTDVGKSVVSLLLMQVLFARGYHPFYFKPFQTGCLAPSSRHSDARFVYQHTASLSDRDSAQSILYCHPAPKAPFFSARDAGDAINTDRVLQRVAALREHHSPLVVEAAGGLLVPVTRELLMVDLVRELKCRPLLVARAGLGTINHTLLSIEAMRQREIEPMAVLFVDTDQVPTDKQLVSENMAAIEMFAKVPVAGVIEYMADVSAPPDDAIAIAESLLF